MILALDSSVLLAIFKGEQSAARWLDILVKHVAVGELRICDVVASEIAAFFPKPAHFHQKLEQLNITLEGLNYEACYLSGSIFTEYRKAGGKRDRLIPDFMIGAHALVQADALIASDRGYFRAYFGKLKVIDLNE